MHVRLATPAEFAAIADVAVAAYEEYRETVGEDAWEGIRARLTDVAAGAASAELLVAVDDDGTVLGSVVLQPAGTTGPPLPREWASVRSLAVAPSARGRGVGAALMEACTERAREQGAPVLGLYTTEMMQAARAMYTRLGFVHDAMLPPHFGQPCWRFSLDLRSAASGGG